jgi:hypothetical protein
MEHQSGLTKKFQTYICKHANTQLSICLLRHHQMHRCRDLVSSLLRDWASFMSDSDHVAACKQLRKSCRMSQLLDRPYRFQ